MSGSLVGSVGVAEEIGGNVGVMVGVSVSVGVSVMVGVRVGVKVGDGGKVAVRLANGLAVGTGDELGMLAEELPVGAIVAANGVCCTGWQAASSELAAARLPSAAEARMRKVRRLISPTW